MKKIKIVYFGASNYSLFFLKNLIKKKIDIAGICTIKKNKTFWTDSVDLSNYEKKKKLYQKSGQTIIQKK